ncbi:MAG: alpha/beta fold hydrolase, partial [Chloroflexota bacterium]
MAKLTIQGMSTHVEMSGEGQPIIFIHGNPDDAHMWDGVIAHMPSGFQFIAPDLPGFGQSRY